MVDDATTERPGTAMRSYSSTMETTAAGGSLGSTNTNNGNVTARNHHPRRENESDERGGSSDEKPFLPKHMSMDDRTTTMATSAGIGGSDGSNDTLEYNMPMWALALLGGGAVLGMAFPKNPHLPSPTWQLLSNVIGFTYFLAWSLSFYPQILLNRQRRTTRGLSVDFCVLNVLGYVCYTTYTTNFYWNDAIIKAYKEKNYGGGDGVSETQITVQGNDVAFAIHAVVMASVTLSQIGAYDTFTVRPPSRRVVHFLYATAAFCSLYLLSTRIFQGRVNFLGFLYVLGSIKIGITIAKYIPQALLNRSRRSTVGWNVYNVILDLAGGILSLVQLLGDCADMGDWTGITGNPAKIAIALVTICFDLLFLVQHYLLYPVDGPSYSTLPTIEPTEIK